MTTTKKQRRIVAGITAAVLAIGGSVIAVQSVSAARERAEEARLAQEAAQALQEAVEGLNEVQTDLAEVSQDRDEARDLLEKVQDSALDAVTLADKLVKTSKKYIDYIEPASSVKDLVAARDALVEVAGIEQDDEDSVTFTLPQVDAVEDMGVVDTTSIDKVKAATEQARHAITDARTGTEKVITYTETVSGSTRDVVRAALAVVSAAETSGKAFDKPAYAPAKPWKAYKKALKALGADLDGSENLAALVKTYGKARKAVLSEAKKAKAAAEEAARKAAEEARRRQQYTPQPSKPNPGIPPRKPGTSQPPKSGGGKKIPGGRVIPIDPKTGKPYVHLHDGSCKRMKCYG